MRYLLAVLLSFSMPAVAVQLSPQGCEALAMFVQGTAESRDIGADQTKHWALTAQKNAGLSEEMLRLLKREFDRVYASKATPEALLENTFQRCLAAEGKVGEES